jgi:NAD(P)-dependent dehydrogenase (short-subunit alcohol dehydrogenase family)
VSRRRTLLHTADVGGWPFRSRLGAQIADKEPRIDILINNAGAMFGTRKLTEDGLERTFALNHMGYFVFTEGLRERLLASGRARTSIQPPKRIGVPR